MFKLCLNCLLLMVETMAWKCEMRETLSRDAKTLNRRTTVAAWRDSRIARQSTATSISQFYTSPSPTSPKHHICQNGRSPRKEVPRPCWYVQCSSLRPLETMCPIADSFAVARPMAPFYIAGSYTPYTHAPSREILKY
jgi:hypothetical protein